MMDWTDRHFRYLARLLTARTVLYTEMVVDATLLHSARASGYLRHSAVERPLVAQLGGSDPVSLAAAAAAVLAAGGFDGINLNCGCPSPRVAGRGCFGAALMLEPARVAAAVDSMAAAAGPALPISVKCRLGVDGMDSYAAFAAFLATVSASGACTRFIVHARRCLTRGLSPKDNRTVPPLRYHWVQRAALEFPHLSIGINGGVEGLPAAAALLLLRPAAPPPAAAEAAGPSSSGSGGGGCGVGGEGGGGAHECAGVAVGDGGAVERDDVEMMPARSLRRREEAAAAATARGGGGDSGGGGGSGGGAAASPVVQLASDGFPKDPMLQLEPGVERRAFPPPGVSRVAEVAAASAAATSAASAAAPPPADASDASSAALRVLRRRSAFSEHPSPGCPSVLELVEAQSGGLLSSVMLGRIAYTMPWILADADRVFFGARNPGLSRREVIAAYLRYATELLPAEVPAEEMASLPAIYAPHVLMKPLLNLFHGCEGGARFRVVLSTAVNERKLGLAEAVAAALAQAPLLEADLDERPPL